MTYTEAFKSKMVQRLVGPDAVSQCELSRRTGVPQATLSEWVQTATLGHVKRRKNKKHGALAVAKSAVNTTSSVRSAEERLRLLAEASRLSDAELGEFLRREGLHQSELDEWREAALDVLRPEPKQPGRGGDAKRIKELERQLHRKDKALAEAAALLMLQKKVQALWAVADDDTEPESDE